MTIEVFAPAKINLTLHVTGLRDDGYHLLDSLVVFAPFGDQLNIRAGQGLTLAVDGPEAAAVPTGPENLVLRAADLLAAEGNAALHLTKNLPASSGIGGGSADAAAALRGLSALWDLPELQRATGDELSLMLQEILELGADIPMCLSSNTCRVRGVGGLMDQVVGLPPIPALVINPRVPVSTPAVFKGLKTKNNPAMPASIPGFETLQDLAAWLSEQRNDLEVPAIAATPVIAEVLQALNAGPDILLARMSGSGATCFGIFPDLDAAQAARATIIGDHPNWWSATGLLGDQLENARPRIS